MAEGAAAGRPRAQLIEAEYGVGKSAFLSELVDTQAAGVPVVAQHFCQFDAIATLAPGRFVSSIAAQLAAALPAYRAAIEAEEAAGHQRWACRCFWGLPHEARPLACGSLPQLRTARIPQRRHEQAGAPLTCPDCVPSNASAGFAPLRETRTPPERLACGSGPGDRPGSSD